ncbi:lariat debranching enzyme, C-terminal domain-domain-containing protein [Microdochium bolleyi]|uniref:Lariat debranching enzyme, C-terminal domain-domain-containing protein n=1 Tax=Microdochium bolleyi TaxID=196109 RepID=A0A136JH23_9PEZI|nr:lariat debranching enzyme, C-terminal domain-domain-containing protein [Microdochium bolleyi]
MESHAFESEGVRVAVEGCGHGTLDAIYASVGNSAKARGWDGVDLLIIGGDFEAVRNAADLSVMSVPVKYRELGDFPAYYNGTKTAPYLTIFIAGNHEASSYLWELYYGGWVAPNIYYLGAANVLRFGPLRIAGMSGIWKGFDYRKPHHERLPFSQDDIKSFYHVREVDVRKLLQIREQVDVGLSHDWPRAVENHGNARALWKMKPDFERESKDGSLGNPAATYVMDRLRPAYWFSAHMHCKFSAVKTYDAPSSQNGVNKSVDSSDKAEEPAPAAVQTSNSTASETAANPDEIDLDMDDDDSDENKIDTEVKDEKPSTHEPAEPAGATKADTTVAGISEELRAQLPASFAKPAPQAPKSTPGQPVPPTITNTTTRFLALDKCLPGRKYIQLASLSPLDPAHLTVYPPIEPSPAATIEEQDPTSSSTPAPCRYKLQYDPEWLAITRVFHPTLQIGDRSAMPPPDLGEATYSAQIDTERAWIESNIVTLDKLDVPHNFQITAPPHQEGDPETVDYQPQEYTNNQTAEFCTMLGLENIWDASETDRAERMARGPPPNGTESDA